MKHTLYWILFVLKRFNAADTKGRSAITGLFSVLGIAFGVTALIVILSVMNGFQQSFIHTILQVSSGHVRLKGTAQDIQKAAGTPYTAAVYLFSETQTLMQGRYGRQHPGILRAVPYTVLDEDTGFADTITITEGSFDIRSPFSIVLGYELARMLSVGAGDTVTIAALAGNAGTELFPENTELLITGLAKTGYYEIDSTFSFISHQTDRLISGRPEPAPLSDTEAAGFSDSAPVTALVKLHNPESDRQYLAALHAACPALEAESWRSYNHAFFGALRIEKNTMFMLVFLIFIVVTVNIYNGMRRSIYERREEIAMLSSFGAHRRHIQALFIANGFSIGFIGSFIGLLLGLLLSADINGVFYAAETGVNLLIEALTFVLEQTDTARFAIFSPQYFYLDKVPVRIFFGEVFTVFLFGTLSASIAAWIAAKKILNLQPAEVLRYE